jgi:hypothetical protein
VRWAADIEEFLRKADPDVGALSNRVAGNWRPLGIADATSIKAPAMRLRMMAPSTPAPVE